MVVHAGGALLMEMMTEDDDIMTFVTVSAHKGDYCVASAAIWKVSFEDNAPPPELIFLATRGTCEKGGLGMFTLGVSLECFDKMGFVDVFTQSCKNATGFYGKCGMEHCEKVRTVATRWCAGSGVVFF